MRYDPHKIAKKLRSLADKLDKLGDDDHSVAWHGLVTLLDRGEKDLERRKEKP